MSLDEAWKVISQGSPAVLAVVVWALVTGRVIPRFIYDSMVKDRDGWRERADKAMGVAKGVVEREGS